jgi:primary-amine oxidase
MAGIGARLSLPDDLRRSSHPATPVVQLGNVVYPSCPNADAPAAVESPVPIVGAHSPNIRDYKRDAKNRVVVFGGLCKKDGLTLPLMRLRGFYMRRVRAHRSLAVGVAALWFLIAYADHSQAAHPLDPLSRTEIGAAVAILKAEGKADAATWFALIELQEPDKAVVLGWRPEHPMTRKAFVVMRRNARVYEAVIDLTGLAVERWEEAPDVQPAFFAEELGRAQRIVTNDLGWQAAMRQRGYELAALEVFCAPLPAGYFGDSTEARRRLTWVTCFDTAGTSNVWARPIEGLLALVDLDENRVVRLSDSGPVPVSRDPARFDHGSRSQDHARTPGKINFAVIDNQVRWKNWAFHYRMSARAGLVLSLLRYFDRGRERMVLYRGSLAEIFVPYMDPLEGWSFRTYLDMGEYGVGRLSLPLAPGSDCPVDALFLGAPLADEKGFGHDQQGVICLFERDAAGPLWRHAEAANKTYAGRTGSELVVRTIPSLGNYDYLIDWVIAEDGAIRIDVGATGIVAARGVATRSMIDKTAAVETAHGALVAPNLVGVDHDHFLSFRLDVDIDGAANSLVRRTLVPARLPGSGDRRSVWQTAEQAVESEGPLAAERHGGAQMWRIVNPNRTNGLGQVPGYELRLGHSVTSLLAEDDPPQRRAAFSAAPLWVTIHDPAQLYAAGSYPNQSKGGDGLPAYVAQRRPIANTDIVLWCTIGFHHLPRPEDWPVMPTMWHSLSLIPNGFFDRNPTVE